MEPLLAARVEFVDGSTRREVDLLRRLNGIDAREVLATAVRFDGRGDLPALLVIHPVLLFEQRLHLMVELDEYRTEHALAQARLAIAIVRERLLDELHAGWPAARKSVGRALDVATGKLGRTVHEQYGVEALDAIPESHPSYPTAFLTEQRPRMVARRR